MRRCGWPLTRPKNSATYRMISGDGGLWKMILPAISITGWWFGTWIFYDFPYTENFITPTDELHHFSEGWLNHQPDMVIMDFSSFFDFSPAMDQMIWIRQGQAMGGAELSSKLLVILIGISQTSRLKQSIWIWHFLVGGLEHDFYNFPFSWEVHHPNWRSHIFQRGGSTTNQFMIFHGIPTKSPWTLLGDWDRISTFDPLGMTAHPPTIAACKAKLDIPELKVRRGTPRWVDP